MMLAVFSQTNIDERQGANKSRQLGISRVSYKRTKMITTAPTAPPRMPPMALQGENTGGQLPKAVETKISVTRTPNQAQAAIITTKKGQSVIAGFFLSEESLIFIANIPMQDVEMEATLPAVWRQVFLPVATV